MLYGFRRTTMQQTFATVWYCMELADVVQRFIDAGRTEDPYEDAIRDMVLGTPPDPVGVEDITGIPWIEIDYPEDVSRAEADILPRI